MTGTAKVESRVSTERARPSRKAAKKASNSTQATNARKAWEDVPAEQRSQKMRDLVKQRWAANTQNVAEAELYFKTADLDEAMEAYQDMRKIYEMAGKTIDTRFQAERQQEERCSNPKCPFEPGGKRFDRNTPWLYRTAMKDPNTGRLYNVFACSTGCQVAIGAPGTKPREAPASDARYQAPPR